jgi:cytochrome c biogenesis protein CcmG, thiol:disulfide interchange protein DsbE
MLAPLFLAALLVSMFAFPEPLPAVDRAAVGSPAPRFVLEGIDGESYDLRDVVKRNRATIINFWATWCPPCVSELPQMGDLYNKMRDGGVALLAINAREQTAVARDFARDMNAKFPVLLDPGGTTAKAYNIESLPVTLIVDHQGLIRQRIVGATTPQGLRGKIQSLLDERTP